MKSDEQGKVPFSKEKEALVDATKNLHLTGVEQQGVDMVARAPTDAFKRIGRQRKTTSSDVAVDQIQARLSAEFGRGPNNTGAALFGLNLRFIVGAMVARRRHQLGLSQVDLSLMYGSSRELISQIESGRTEINCGDLPRLAEILDIPVTDLFGLVEGKEERASIVREAEAMRVRVARSEVLRKIDDEELIRVLSRMQERVSLGLTEEERQILDTFRGSSAKTRTTLLHVVPALARSLNAESEC